jgi:hypothetical protein
VDDLPWHFLPESCANIVPAQATHLGCFDAQGHGIENSGASAPLRTIAVSRLISSRKSCSLRPMASCTEDSRDINDGCVFHGWWRSMDFY